MTVGRDWGLGSFGIGIESKKGHGMKMEFMVDKTPVYRGRGVQIRICEMYDGKHSPCYVDLPTMRPLIEGQAIPPALNISESEAQQLCDALWEAGIRPTNGAGSTGQLAATQEHLADMKTIAFSALKIAKNG